MKSASQEELADFIFCEVSATLIKAFQLKSYGQFIFLHA
jgi:hypothetical protein